MFELNSFNCGEALPLMQSMPDNSVDLVFSSPPYKNQRTYEDETGLFLGAPMFEDDEHYVRWMVEHYVEALRVSKGLVAMVIEGKTKQFDYDATPFLILADLKRRGIKVRKPPVFFRYGIPGSGGPDWLRNDWEPIICAASGRLPWSDNIAMGKPTKYDEGGACSHRKRNGVRVNAKDRRKLGGHAADRKAGRAYAKPKSGIANPGNVIKCNVGGGQMGSKLASENEAPFPESLAEFFIRSFCPPGGVVLDCFSGSGTTGVVARRFDRNFLGFDVRESQITLSQIRRISKFIKG